MGIEVCKANSQALQIHLAPPMDTKLTKGSFVFLTRSIMAISGKRNSDPGTSMPSFQLILNLERGERGRGGEREEEETEKEGKEDKVAT